eukprot:TRINITY_DN1118_c0_g1_i2.p1 TRINITY_DN1118_c0_g1~~TRINITY_DN1118_c0_g1_i2.p1  ORF type:complete len:660 (+),score=127.43 TRINITY_DN1118_c0_g1_i2:716-2695(+)
MSLLGGFQKLVKSETEYFNTLVTLKNFQRELRRASEKSKIGISFNEVTAIFSNVDRLSVLQGEFLNHLKNLEAKWPFISGIGRAFLSIAEALKLYGEYADNYQNARRTLTNLSSKPKLWASIMEIGQTAGMDHNADLFQMILEPSNRIKMYETIFEEQLNYYANDHILHKSEKDDLIAAYGLVQQWSDLLAKRSHNSHYRARVLSVQNKVIGSINLVVEGRDLYSEGFIGRANKKGKKYHLALFSDMLMISKPRGSDKLKSLETVDLAQIEVWIPPENKNKDTLEIKTPLTLYKLADVSAKCTSWMNDITDLSRKKKNKVFGVHLTEVLEQEQQRESGIPLVVEVLVTWLRNHNASSSEGLLRISGSASKTSSLKSQLDRAIKPEDIETSITDSMWETPHDVAAILKAYFKELPDPLLTFNLYDDFLATQKDESLSTEQQVFKIRELVQNRLPKENKKLLRYLIDYLYEVQLDSTTNFMTIQNLAIVITPNILRPREATLQSAMDGPYLLGVTQLMIEFREKILSDVPIIDLPQAPCRPLPDVPIAPMQPSRSLPSIPPVTANPSASASASASSTHLASLSTHLGANPEESSGSSIGIRITPPAKPANKRTRNVSFSVGKPVRDESDDVQTETDSPELTQSPNPQSPNGSVIVTFPPNH